MTDNRVINIVEVTASTNPGVGITFETTAYLIPRFDTGLQAFAGFGPSASIFVDLNASAYFTISTRYKCVREREHDA